MPLCEATTTENNDIMVLAKGEYEQQHVYLKNSTSGRYCNGVCGANALSYTAEGELINHKCEIIVHDERLLQLTEGSNNSRYMSFAEQKPLWRGELYVHEDVQGNAVQSLPTFCLQNGVVIIPRITARVLQNWNTTHAFRLI